LSKNEQRVDDGNLLVPSVETHQQRLSRMPDMVAGFYSEQGEARLHETGVNSEKSIFAPDSS
jgi:hypothetical protein